SPVSALGGQEDSSPTAPGKSTAKGALCQHPPALAQAAGLGAAQSATGPTRSGAAASRADGTDPAQPGLDCGFQRLVPHGGWRAPRAADGARSVQPLRSVSAPVAPPGRSAGPSRHAAIVSPT